MGSLTPTLASGEMAERDVQRLAFATTRKISWLEPENNKKNTPRSAKPTRGAQALPVHPWSRRYGLRRCRAIKPDS